jgi:4-alpha-glucanotransferase
VTALRRLAAAYGVTTGYRGLDGLTVAGDEAVLATLRSLGAPVENLGDVPGALRERREAIDRRLLEPVAVLWDDSTPGVVLSHRQSASGRGFLSLACEDGTLLEQGFDLEDATALRVRAGIVKRRIPLGARPPLGYHRFSVRLGAESAEGLLVCAPRRAYRGPDRERAWGLFAPLYAVHSSESRGAGDLSDLRRLTETASRYGAGFVGTLPLLATFLEDPSPYSPASRLFWNELYVDPRRTPEWERSEAMRIHATMLDSMTPSPFIDYEELDRRRRPLLAALSRDARAHRPESLASYQRENPEVLAYSRFRAARESESEAEPDRVLYHLYAQMTAEEQLAEIARDASRGGVRLYLDLPLGVRGGGFDRSRWPSLFARSADVGAPPDAVFPDGQNWGFPPLRPEASRLEGHRYFRESLRQSMRHAGVLRVDHVMGLHRQFWIPEGVEKRDGVYVRYPAEELYAVANLESHRNRCELVGENLGIVPGAVNRALFEHGWRGIFVLQYGLTGNAAQPVLPIPRDAVASFNTHDTPTLSGFCRSRDLQERVEGGLLEREKAQELSRARGAAIDLLDAVLGVDAGRPRDRLERWLSFLARSEADLLMVTLEDLWLEEAPQNVPGRVDLPNWRRRMRYSIEALPSEAQSLLERFSRRQLSPKSSE